jgi:ribonuclease G
MKRELLVNATPRETRVAILEDGQLVELLVDRPDARRMVGDVYLGKVEAVLPGIQAAFVNIGTEKSAFLHAADVVVENEQVSDDDDDDEDSSDDSGGGGRRGRREVRPIQDLLKRGQDILVQITKEPISTKGPRVTAQVSLAGRFLVYMPFASKVGVSRKIDERGERQRLRAMVGEMLPDDAGGVIVRTVSEDATKETFERELNTLMNNWKRIKRKTQFLRAPALVHRETNAHARPRARPVQRQGGVASQVDSKQVFNEIVEYLQGIAPGAGGAGASCMRPTVPLFDKAGVETEIRDLFKRRCELPSGGYLIIEPTEALVSIDVNSGRFTGKT